MDYSAFEAVLVGRKDRNAYGLLRAHIAVQEPGSLSEAPSVSAQVDLVRHGPPVAIGGKPPAAERPLKITAELGARYGHQG